jgi:hypothetical protein
MVPLPRDCSNCRAELDEADPKRRLAMLENGRALCSACTWLVDHADGEGKRERRKPVDLPARSWDPSAA